MARLFHSSQITPAFRLKTFENFTSQGVPPVVRAMKAVTQKYAAEFDQVRHQENSWLALLGEPGCGKTHLAAAVANVLLTRGIGLLYFQHIEGMGELMDALRNSKEDRITDKLMGMKKIDVLIWDDLFKPLGGQSQPREFEVKVAIEVLNYRYLNLLPTIISSERTPEDLVRIDKALGSRIIERAKGRITVAEGIEANYRLRG